MKTSYNNPPPLSQISSTHFCTIVQLTHLIQFYGEFRVLNQKTIRKFSKLPEIELSNFNIELHLLSEDDRKKYKNSFGLSYLKIRKLTDDPVYSLHWLKDRVHMFTCMAESCVEFRGDPETEEILKCIAKNESYNSWVMNSVFPLAFGPG